MDGGNPLRLQPVGQSGAAAVVVAALYLLGAAAAVGSWIWTGFLIYDFLVVACIFRMVGFAARAVYLLGSYHPSLQGIYLAFTNAGYGASLINVFLVTAVWMKKPHQQLLRREQAFYSRFFYVWCLPVVAFGPITGVVAAGVLYGDASAHGLLVGNRLKKAAVWGLCCCSIVCWFLIGRISIATLLSSGRLRILPSRKPTEDVRSTPRCHCSQESDDDEHRRQPSRQEQLFVILWVCATLLLMRGILGVLSAYASTKYTYSDDNYYYPLYEIPELLSVAILVQPTLMARIAMVYPKPPSPPAEDHGSKHDSKSAYGHDGLPDIEAAPVE